MVLEWGTPPRAVPAEEWARCQADGAPPGTYQPNMDDDWRARWKARLTGQRTGELRAEVRRTFRNGTQVKMVFAPDGSMLLSANGTADFSAEDLDSLFLAAREARSAMRACESAASADLAEQSRKFFTYPSRFPEAYPVRSHQGRKNFTREITPGRYCNTGSLDKISGAPETSGALDAGAGQDRRGQTMPVERGSTMTFTGILVTEECSDCHIVYAMPQAFREQALNEGPKMTFYCPRGHRQHYTVSEVSRLRSELSREQAWRKGAEARERAARDQADAAQRSKNAYKGHLTRTRKRIGNGTCPCCNRHFADVERHMSTKHPGYAETEQAL